MQIKIAVKRCYFAVEPCIVYTTRQLLPVAKKDVLPAFHQSNIVYQFLCHCDSRYVGRTSLRQSVRGSYVSATVGTGVVRTSWSKNHTLVSAPSIGRFFYQS